jgi:hypothetical protein
MTPQAFPKPIFQLEKPQFSEACRLILFEKVGNHTTQVDDDLAGNIHPDLRCNTQLNYNVIKSYCETRKVVPGFAGISAMFLTKGLSDTEFVLRFAKIDVCNEPGGEL